MRRLITILLVAALLLPALAVGTARPAAAGHLQTNASANTTAVLNLRAGAGTDHRVLRVIPDGERVFVVSGPTDGHWYEVTYDGIRGYALGDYLAQNQIFLSLRPDSGPPGTEVTILGSGAEPGEQIDVLFAIWEAGQECRAARGAELVERVTADDTGRFRATHLARRFTPSQIGYTYTANDPREQTEVSVLCFEFSTDDEPRSRYFPQTDHTVSGAFLRFWERNGGLAVFGYPLTEAFAEESLQDGEVYTVQYFERQRFEHHPENQPPYDVLLGLMGTEALPGEFDLPRAAPANSPDCIYFEATGHNLCHGFLAYWRSHGLDLGDPDASFRESLALFGYPVTEEFRAELEDGQVHTIQYFERARFEWHPGNPEPYTVLLGQLGREVLLARYGGQLPPRAR